MISSTTELSEYEQTLEQIEEVIHHDHEPTSTEIFTTELSDVVETTSTKYHQFYQKLHHDIQEPKIKNHDHSIAKREVTSTTTMIENLPTTESSSKIGKFFENSWGSLKNKTSKVTHNIKEKVMPVNDVQKTESTTKYHEKSHPKNGPPIIHMA